MRSTATVTQMVPNPGGSDDRRGGAGAGGSRATGPANAPVSASSNRTRALGAGLVVPPFVRPGPAGRFVSPPWGAPPSGGLHVRRLQSLLRLLDFELHRLASLQALEARHLDGLVMDEHVRPFGLRDKAKALFRVEPLHGAGRHTGDSFRRWCIGSVGKARAN